MNNIRHIAQRFVVDNKINSLEIELPDIIRIVKNNGWRILSFRERPDLIKELGLEDAIINCNGLTYVLPGENYEQIYIIFYRDDQSYKDKIYTIAHEIGHIINSHTYVGSILGKSYNRDIESVQEIEADISAYEILAPRCILNRMGIDTAEEITKVSSLPLSAAEVYIKEIHKTTDIVEDDREKEIIESYSAYLQSYKRKKRHKKMKILRPAIIVLALLAVCLGVSVSINYNNALQQNRNDDVIVYITKTGAKYHKLGCSYIKNKEINDIKIKDAEGQGYKPCKICEPDK